MLIPEWLYILLLTSGVTVIAVLLYLRRQWRRFMNVLKRIQQLNDDVERDLIDFLDGLCNSLHLVSVCGLHWRLDWFGQTIVREQGKISGYAHRFELLESDANLQLTFYVNSARWEQTFYFELLRQQLRSLCALDLALKMRQVTSFEQGVARYQLFLAHDLKNLAQMVVLWQRQVQDTPASDAVNALQRWQAVAPLIADRAALLAKRLSAPGEKQTQNKSTLISIRLPALIARLKRWAQVHAVKLDVTQEIVNVAIIADWEGLDDASFQLMRNYQQHADLNDSVLLSFACDNNLLTLTFEHAQLVDIQTFKRMQEPLWTSSEQGFGLGLWQIGQVLERMNGRFGLLHTEKKSVSFIWQLRINDEQ